MSAQPKNVPGAGTTERQEDWSLPSMLKELAMTGSLSRRKKAFFKQDAEKWLNRLASFEFHDIPHIAPKRVCDALGAAEGSFWLQIACQQLDAMGVPHPDAEDGEELTWSDVIDDVLWKLENNGGVHCPRLNKIVPLSQAAREVDHWAYVLC